MDIALGVGGVVFTALDFCVGALALLMGGRRIPVEAPAGPQGDRLNPIERLAVRVASNQRMQGVVAGLAVGGMAFASFFFYRAFSGTTNELIRVMAPSGGDAVPRQIIAEIKARGLQGGETLAVLVRPLPDDPSQSYWVQEQPSLIDAQRWRSDPVYLGNESDPAGTPFNLCAVITRASLTVGDHVGALPSGPRHCVSVTRR